MRLDDQPLRVHEFYELHRERGDHLRRVRQAVRHGRWLIAVAVGVVLFVSTSPHPAGSPGEGRRDETPAVVEARRDRFEPVPDFWAAATGVGHCRM